ncbi:MAG TPA: GON domain-containing protein [Kofleriaceae bacterium]
MVERTALVVLWLAACGFTSHSESPALIDGAPPVIDTPIDTPAVGCGALTCDPNATCTTSGAAACVCKLGFTGDGLTCRDIDECASQKGGCPAECTNTPGSFACYAPATCAEIKAHVPAATDGDYALYLGGSPGKPWKGYCAGMATRPLEYLSLSGANSAQYSRGGASTGTDVKTTYSKVRFDPTTMKIDITDRTFASSMGTILHSGNTPVTSMPYGVAMDCRGAGSKAGVAMIDLTSTAFALTGAAEFAVGGNQPGSDLQLSAANQKATISGGGFCGWNAPAGVPVNPFNNNVTSGLLLGLVYQP